jgi:glycosyltransferase involved in cell wall biosynthesis
MKKKVLFVAYTFPPFGGGGEPVAYNVLDFLKDNPDLAFDVLTSRDLNSKRFPNTVEKTNFHTVPIWRNSMTSTGVLGMAMFVIFGAWKLWRLLRKNNYDYIHYWTSVPSGLLSFLHHGKIPYLITLYGGDIPRFITGELQFFHTLTRRLNKTVVRNANMITAMSQTMKKAAHDEWGPIDIAAICNAANFPPNDPRLIQRKPGPVTRLISVGRLLDWKRFDMAILATGRCDGVELTIVGDGPERKSLENLAARTCPDKVRFLGLVDKNRVYEELLKSDIFILPSIADAFGNVYVEAMACGLPVIAAKAGGVWESIENNVNGFLVQPDNLDEMVDKVNFLKDVKERKKMSKEALRLFEEKFTWPILYEQYKSVYTKLNIGWES